MKISKLRVWRIQRNRVSNVLLVAMVVVLLSMFGVPLSGGQVAQAATGLTVPDLSLEYDTCLLSAEPGVETPPAGQTYPNSGDTIQIVTTVTNDSGGLNSFLVVFKVVETGTTTNLFSGGSTYTGTTLGVPNWPDSQVVNTPLMASGASFDVVANFTLGYQMLRGLTPGGDGKTRLDFIVELWYADFSSQIGASQTTAGIPVQYTALNQCTIGGSGGGGENRNVAAVVTTDKPYYFTSDQICVEWGYLANDPTTWGDTGTGATVDIVELSSVSSPRSGDPEGDYADGANSVVRTITTTDWSVYTAGTDQYTGYYCFGAGGLVLGQHYLVRLQPWAEGGSGTSSHPVWTPQWTYFYILDPTAVDVLGFTASGDVDAFRVRWQTTNEIDNLGFNLYRSESVDGPRLKLNDALIPSRMPPGSALGADYEYHDLTAGLGVVYYYWLEAVDIRGHSDTYGPASAGVLTLVIDPVLWSLPFDLFEVGE